MQPNAIDTLTAMAKILGREEDLVGIEDLNGQIRYMYLANPVARGGWSADVTLEAPVYLADFWFYEWIMKLILEKRAALCIGDEPPIEQSQWWGRKIVPPPPINYDMVLPGWRL